MWSKDEVQTQGTLWRQHMQWCLELLRNISKASAARAADVDALRVGASAADQSGVPGAAAGTSDLVGVQLRAALLDIARAHVDDGVCDDVVTAAIFRRVLGCWINAKSSDVGSAAHWAPLYGGARRWLVTESAVRGGICKVLLAVWRSQLLLQMEAVLKCLGISCA